MWNYSFMVPSLLILFTLLAFYFARSRLPLRLNRTFLGVLTIHMYVVLFDFVSSRADELHEQFSIGALYTLNTLFFVFFLARIVWLFQITLDVLNLTPRLRRAPPTWLFSLPYIVGEVLSISSFATGAVFTIDAAGYHKGPCYNILYVCQSDRQPNQQSAFPGGQSLQRGAVHRQHRAHTAAGLPGDEHLLRHRHTDHLPRLPEPGPVSLGPGLRLQYAGLPRHAQRAIEPSQNFRYKRQKPREFVFLRLVH